MKAIVSCGWRLLMALALAVAPWPPAAYAMFAAAPEAAMPCHENAPPAAADTTKAGAGCEDGCCPDPACDPAHCVLLQAGNVAAWRLAVSWPAPRRPPLPTRARVPPDVPSLPGLRPPIA